MIIRDEVWSDTERYLEFMSPHAPDGRHVEVVLDDRGFRCKPEADT